TIVYSSGTTTLTCVSRCDCVRVVSAMVWPSGPRSYPSFRPHPDGRAPAGATDVAVRRSGKPLCITGFTSFRRPHGPSFESTKGNGPGLGPEKARGQGPKYRRTRLTRAAS